MYKTVIRFGFVDIQNQVIKISVSSFAKEVTFRTRAKTVVSRDHALTVRGIHDKPGLFISRYLGRNG